jgi:hypothetical protein
MKNDPKILVANVVQYFEGMMAMGVVQRQMVQQKIIKQQVVSMHAI